jgi:hypothetical protein
MALRKVLPASNDVSELLDAWRGVLAEDSVAP